MKGDSTIAHLSIRNLRFHAFHGVASEERKLGGKYAIDLEIWYDASAAVQTDQLSDAINYEEVIETLYRSLNEHKFYLIEKVADYLLEKVMSRFHQIQKAQIRVRKLFPPVTHILDYIEVELQKQR